MSRAEKLLDRCVFVATALAITVLPERLEAPPRLQPRYLVYLTRPTT
ncbi:MAG TPA: hypothetical protein PLP31_00040 [Thermoanaerobaculaceae bacterium]|nr:hypothetical protein [Thermoanaerobaculaceae bacterium]